MLSRLQLDEKEYMARTVMDINAKLEGAYVFSSGKNMGVFKAVGFPEDVGRFYRLEEYSAYSWTAHGRYPTNTPGWWGGAHPFALITLWCTMGRFLPMMPTAGTLRCSAINAPCRPTPR